MLLSHEINLYSDKINETLSFFALTFMLQSSIIPIYRQNKNQDKNSRDLLISYLIGYIILSYIGIFGYFALLGQKDSLKNAKTILEILPQKDIFLIII